MALHTHPPAAPDKAALRQLARDLGFADCRVASAGPAAHAKEFAQWLADGCHAEMTWMERTPERRSDPTIVLPGARSVVVLAMNYFQGPDARTSAPWRIARYAWGDDYHDKITTQLKAMDQKLAEWGGVQKIYVDTGPVLERDWAATAGLGWNGKSTVQIHPHLGTWFFLAELITTLAFEPDSPHPDRCGSCTRCLTACPTGAITPHRLDARLCLSYWSIEHRGSIPETMRRAMGNRIYGCDDCLEACPWNRFASVSQESTFAARAPVFSRSLREFLSLTTEEFRELFRKSPIKRIKRGGFLRNVCIALGNTGTREDIPALEIATQDPDEIIAEHALWAIGEIQARLATAEIF